MNITAAIRSVETSSDSPDAAGHTLKPTKEL
jgi:hypothetical protein